MAGAGILEVSDATFEQEVLKSEQPVLVDFLGGLVWPMQGDRTDRGRHGADLRGQAEGGEGRRGSQRSYSFPIRNSGNSRVAVLQGRESRRSGGRLRASKRDRGKSAAFAGLESIRSNVEGTPGQAAGPLCAETKTDYLYLRKHAEYPALDRDVGGRKIDRLHLDVGWL